MTAARSTPVVPIQTPILHRLREVIGGHVRGFVQIGYRAGHFQDAVVRARRKAHAADGHFQRALAGVVQSADLADRAGDRREL